jgi:hypothetical protein
MTSPELRATYLDLLHSYCRGIDRLHKPSIAAAFHPGAQLIDYGPEPAPIEAFVERAVDSLGKRFVATQHRVSNVTVEQRSAEQLLAEVYVHATHIEQTDTGRNLHTFVGRYIDLVEQRDGVWRIAQRTLRQDWTMVQPMGDPMAGSYRFSGRGATSDPIWD